MVSEHLSGYISGFSVYTGKTANDLVAEKATLDPYCSVMMKTVMGLLQKTKLLDNHHTVFFDNLFNSCELLEEMLYRDQYGAGKFQKLHPHIPPNPIFT